MKTVRQLMRFRAPAAKSWRMAVAAVAFVAATGCGSSETSGPNGRPTGRWVGSFASAGFTMSIDVVMVEDATGKVTGNGFLSSAFSGIGNTSAVTAAGTFVAPNLSVNLSTPGITPLNMTGRITGDTFNAQLNGSGLDNETMILTRQ